jgi:hypothetical protein
MCLFTTKDNVPEIRFFNLQLNLIFSPNLNRRIETPGDSQPHYLIALKIATIINWSECLANQF